MREFPASGFHKPDPHYIKSLMRKIGMTQKGIARRLGITPRVLRYYTQDTSAADRRECPYLVQYALEQLVREEEESKRKE